MTAHADHRFSVTVKTDDPVLVGCLRSIADYSQKMGNKRIAWGGTKDADWRKADKRITFRFSDPEYRDIFKAEAKRLLPNTLFDVWAESDKDPATPQGR